jgi:outer membrane protein assembly factor BamB
LNDEIDNDDNYFAPNSPFGRSTRAGTPWPMHLNNPTHTSYTLDTGPTTSDILWFNSTGGTTYGSPALVDGVVYIGGGNGMNAFYANNGTLKWRTNIGNVAGGTGLSSSPAVDNGYVFFGGNNTIYCLWANNGTIKWMIPTASSGSWGDGTPTVANGKVFVGGRDWKLYAIEQDTGNVLWTFQTSSSGSANYGLYAAPAVVNGLVYLAAGDGNLYQINEVQPTSIATANYFFVMAYHSYSAPVVANGRVFVGCGYTGTGSNNRFYCLDASDLSLIWEFYPGSPTSFFSSAGFYNNRIYIGSVDGNLYCLDAMSSGPTPTEYWRVLVGQTWSSPAITNDRLYIGSRSNYLYCINLSQPATPFYYWRYNTGDDVDSSPAVSDGKVYVGTHGSGGRIYCFGSSITLEVDYITIEDDSHNELTTVNLNIGESVTAYAAGYNSTTSTFVEYVEVDWTGSGGIWSPGTGTSSTFTAGFSGGLYTQTGQNLILGFSDTFNVNIRPPTMDYIKITNSPDGTELTTVTLPIGETVTAFASGYNYTGSTYVGLFSVEWIGAGGSWFPTIGTSSTFTAGTIGGLYVQTGQNLSLGVSATFNVNIPPPTLDYILITNSPNGAELSTVPLPIGGEITAFASGYNYTGPTYVGLYPVNWSGGGGSWFPTTGISSTFTAGTVGGLYFQTGQNIGLGVSDTFEIDITDPTLDYILITDSQNGNPLDTITLPLGGTLTAFASGYNYTGSTYIGLIEVNWSGLGGNWLPSTGTSSIFTAGFTPGLYVLTGENLSLGVSDSFNVDIINYTLDFIVVTDSPNGTPLETVVLPIGGSVTAFASGYNNTGPTFVGLVEVNWTGPGGIWSPAKGKSSTFTAGATAGFYTLTGQNTSLGISDSFEVDITNWTADFIKIGPLIL